MKKNRIIFLALFLLAFPLVQYGQLSPDAVFPVKGFCIRAPGADGIDRFTKFIDEELAPRGVNALILIVGYHYEYESYPQLRDSAALSKKDVKKIVAVCRKNNIRIIPQINLLGHQSSRNHLNKLLEQFPQFDETPDIKMPEKYEWPNPDNLYCKSYCTGLRLCQPKLQ